MDEGVLTLDKCTNAVHYEQENIISYSLENTAADGTFNERDVGVHVKSDFKT